MGLREDIDSGLSLLQGMYKGEVLDNQDPEKRGRVKAIIPGLIEPSTGWILPIGFPGAGQREAGLGFSWVPQAGSSIIVCFLNGDLDSPLYMPGPWERHSGPDGATNAADADQVVVITTHNFQISFTDKEGREALVIANRITGDSIQIVGNATDGMGIGIKGSDAIVLKADGTILLDAPNILVKGSLMVQVDGITKRVA
jgi:hypothetical protein